MIDRAVEVRKPGQTGLDTKAITLTAEKKEKVNLNGQTDLHMKATSWTTTFMAEALILGPMAEFIRAIGTTIKCMAKVSLNGRTIESMKAST